MNSKRRLLILSCSKRKNDSNKPIPAIERYNGPLFLVLRRFVRNCPLQARFLDVYILSATYGLIPSDFPTALYDRRLNIQRIIELQSQVSFAFSEVLRVNYASVCFVLGKTYLGMFESLRPLVPPHTETKIAFGSIGKKQAQLKEWLWLEQRIKTGVTDGHY